MEPLIGIVASQAAQPVWEKGKEFASRAWQRLRTIKQSVTGQSIDEANQRIEILTAELGDLLEHFEVQIDRLKAMDRDLAICKEGLKQSEWRFGEILKWSQQGWWRRAFSRPNIPPGLLWPPSQTGTDDE
jgi:hypothetical protein